MARFAGRTESDGVLPVPPDRVWAVLTDPARLARMTPLLRSVDVLVPPPGPSGEAVWRWRMVRIAALGVALSPEFTEAMTFTELAAIDFTHRPPPGAHERSGAEGWYRLAEVPGGTHLAISLTLTVELPLPRTAGPAVRAVMRAAMDTTGDRFAANLRRAVGVA